MAARVLIVSMFLAPCREVGGKRFSFLSQEMASLFDEYHVLARKEFSPEADETAFDGHVHRVGAWPVFPPRSANRIVYKLSRAWEEWFCVIDPYSGWVIPAVTQGLQLVRQYGLNVLVVTLPAFSSVLVGIAIHKLSGIRLVLDYRDPMTGMKREWPAIFGSWFSRAAERVALRNADAVVVTSEIMRQDLARDFADVVPGRQAVICNGFVDFDRRPIEPLVRGAMTMVYAGEFYGARRLSTIAPVLAVMLRNGEISGDTFRFQVYSKLRTDDLELIDRLGISSIVREMPRLSYAEIRRVMRSADILFLPSGDDVPHAIPFKFFDYLSARRPILAIAPQGSSVARLMQEIDCGEYSEFGQEDSVRLALLRLLRREKDYSFQGAERFTWGNSARRYRELLESVVGTSVACR